MSATRYSEEIEHRARAYHGDGLLDISMGLALLLIGIGVLVEQLTFAGIWVVLWLPVMLSAKQNITLPRMQAIDFTPLPGAGARARLLLMTIVLTIAMLIILGLVMLLRFDLVPAWLIGGMREHSSLAWSALIASLGILAGWATGVKRLYGYAALAVLGLACGNWLDVSTPIVLTVVGVVIFLAGSVLLLVFVRKYPAVNSSG